MREPDLHVDGWCLEDAEACHAAAPATFHIPLIEIRRILRPGDFAKLIFRVAVQGAVHPAVERMWVIVRERVSDGYLGILDNDPRGIEKNEGFWSGIELPFQPRHIIGVMQGTKESRLEAERPLARRWA